MSMTDLDSSKLLERAEKLKSAPVLFGIFLIAVAVRYSTKHELLFDPDSYVWYQLGMYFAGIRTEHYIPIDGRVLYELRYYPTGQFLDKMLLVLPFTIGSSYRVLGLFGAPQTPEALLNYMFFIGPFLGALTTVAAYSLGKEITGSPKAGFISAVFYSFAHFAMTRNTAGDTGQESLGTLLLIGMLYIFFMALRQTNTKRQLALAALSGVLFLIAANTWGGTSFYWGLLASTLLVYLIINVIFNVDFDKYRNVCVVFPVFSLVGIFVPSLIRVGNSFVIGEFGTGIFQLLSLTIFLISILLLGFQEATKKRNLKVQPRALFLGSFLLIVLILVATGKIETILDFVQRLVFSPDEKGTTGNTVAYYRSTGFQELKSTFSTLLLVVPVGVAVFLYKFYKKRDFNTLFLIIFMFLGLISFRWMIRNSFFLAFIVPLYLGSLVSMYYVKNGAKEGKRETESGVPRAVATMIVVLFFLSPVLAESAESVPRMKYSDQNVIPWRDAGEWIKENTPEDALLIHWWDYGYHLQTFGERRTIVDGGNSGPQVEGGSGNRNIDVAMAFTSPEDDFLRYIGPYNPDNLPIYVLVSLEEFGKSGAINYHATSVGGGNLFITSFTAPNTGNPTQDQQLIMNTLQQNRISTYYIINYGSYYQVWAQITTDSTGTLHPEWSEKLLSKLLPFNTGYGQGLKHFQLLYQNGYVYVYRYVP